MAKIKVQGSIVLDPMGIMQVINLYIITANEGIIDQRSSTAVDRSPGHSRFLATPGNTLLKQITPTQCKNTL